MNRASRRGQFINEETAVSRQWWWSFGFLIILWPFLFGDSSFFSSEDNHPSVLGDGRYRKSQIKLRARWHMYVRKAPQRARLLCEWQPPVCLTLAEQRTGRVVVMNEYWLIKNYRGGGAGGQVTKNRGTITEEGRSIVIQRIEQWIRNFTQLASKCCQVSGKSGSVEIYNLEKSGTFIIKLIQHQFHL